MSILTNRGKKPIIKTELFIKKGSTMGIKSKLAMYRDYKSGIKHCTFDPKGPGVVRIHLIPPKFKLFSSSSYIVILNGYYLLPLGYSWALMLSFFIEETNRFDKKMLDEKAQEQIYTKTLERMHRLYPRIDKGLLEEDLDEMLDIIFEVARGGAPDKDIEKLSIRAYSSHMEAPHRMDLMISAMTDAEGRWKCNQKCRFCYAAGQPLSGTRELSTEEWKSAIDKLRDANVPMLTFTGGEPTQREDLPELVAHASRFITRLNTNGAALTPALAERLRDSELDSVQITLYSSEEKIHNTLVGTDHFYDTVSGIKNALAAGLDVSINTPLCRLNSDYLSTLRMLSSLGVRYVTVSGIICTGSAKANHGANDLSEEELFRIISEAKHFSDENGMEMDFTSPGLLSEERLESLGLHTPSCGAALSNMAIAPDGTVIPCQSWLGGKAELGNILTVPFKRIWNHKTAAALRKMSDKEALFCPFRQSKECQHGKE